MPSISTSSLAVCRWLWCKESFSTRNQLVEHVLAEHVAKAIPIKLKDLPLELRAQDGTSFQDSIPTQMFMDTTEDALLVQEEEQKFIPDDMYIESSNIDDGFMPRIPSRTPSPHPPNTPPSARSSFSALSNGASPSPEPESMRVDPSPSTADIVARIINRANGRPSSPTRPVAQPRSSQGATRDKARHGFRMRAGNVPPSPKKAMIVEASATGTESSSQTASSTQTFPSSQTAPSSQAAPISQVATSDHETTSSHASLGAQAGPSAQIPPLSRPSLLPLPGSNEQPASNAHTPPVVADTIDPAILHPNSQPEPSIVSQSGTASSPRPPLSLQWTDPLVPDSPDFQMSASPSQSSAAPYPPFKRFIANRTGPVKPRPFRTGFVHIAHASRNEPTIAMYHPELLRDPPAAPRQNVPTEALSQFVQSQPPQATAPRFVHEVDLLSSSLEPSMPSMMEVSQTSETQWQLQTQAPYNFDSQFSLDSQSQNALL